ncbi:hypothetical protein [Salipiger mucosus]|uniref:Uncharacterized protein n=1 Tax=Salipiger mucosus DSM 16094 TaxID=1123237 RepID=S9SA13_9RHOB|nr:hypothetical protein [Salipiger mucosus]EPX83079.1 hypothetical protein Salmuc_02877 [Salipiger mucosus DSM 16094]
MPQRVTRPPAFNDHDAPPPASLRAWMVAGHSGAGTPWLRPGEALALARYALVRGEGVRMMEAAAMTLHEPPRDVDWEIIGADAPGENWEDHLDPGAAYDLVRRKLRLARDEGARLQYKLWLAAGAV